MQYRYYNKERLSNADDNELSFGISNNLLDSAFNILQHPFELLKNERRGYGMRPNIEGFELLTSFLSTVTAIELLMKSMVTVKCWKHLFSNPKKVSRKSLINGEFRSINLENCIAIIETLYGIFFDDRIKSRIEVIRAIRNKVTHYYSDFTNDEVFSYISFGLDIFIEIYRSYMKDNVYDANDRTEGFEEDLSDFHQFVEARIESAKVREGNIYKLANEINTECQKCWTINLVLTKENEIKCLYCGNVVDSEEWAAHHADDHTKITKCTQCKKKTVIIIGDQKPKCLICGNSKE